MVVYLVGDITSGFTAVGPFRSYDEAFDWADKAVVFGWAMELNKPGSQKARR